MSNPQFEGSSDISMTPGQAKFMYWFVGTAPILKAMTSITTYWGLRDEALKKLANTSGKAVKKLGKDELRTVYHGVLSDFARQTVTCSFQLMSYFIVGDAIKGILNKVYSHKPPNQQDMGQQQVLKQTIPLGVQVLATIFSRKMGAAQLESLFKVDSKGKLAIPDKETGLSRWLKQHTKPLVEKTLTNSKGELQPFKASMMATSAMVGYFAALVGVLYGISTLLENAFPGTFKSKQPGGEKSASSGSPLQGPTIAGLNAPAVNAGGSSAVVGPQRQLPNFAGRRPISPFASLY